MKYRNNLVVAALGTAILLTACDKPASTAATATQAEDTAALAAQKAELASREAELAAREAAIATAEADAAKLAATEAAAKEAAASELAAKQAAAKTVAAQPAPKPVVRQPTKSAPSTVKVANATKPAPAPVARVVTVPAGTQLPMALSTELSTKTAKVGDTVRARLTNDVIVDGRVAIAAGTTVAGQVTEVISGSSKIGGIPTLAMRFDRLELPGGTDLPISGEITQKGKSDRTRDTVKILGGAAAGAVLGHQVESNDKGKIIGGLLGGAAGAVAAQKTGTEVQLPADTAMSIALAAPLEVTLR